MIKIIAPGKIKDKNLEILINDYLKKINHYHKIEVIEVKDETIINNDSSENIINREGLRILDKINDKDYVVILDLKGKMYDSITFADKVKTILDTSKPLVFVIGGSLGLSKDVIKRADASIKLSDMTFLHQMARLIILEQVFRVFKILNNETYHK